MILNLLLVYCIVAQMIVVTYLFWSARNCAGVAVIFDQINAAPPMRRCLAWLVGIIGTLIAAPVLLPWMCCTFMTCWNEEKLAAKELFELFMEMRLEPIHPANVCDELLEHFETHSPSVMTNGFDLLGDFYLKDAPYNSKARIFLSHDRSTIVEVGVTLETEYIELISFFENGDYATTANVEESVRADDFGKHGMFVNAAGKINFQQLLESHKRFIESLCNTIQQPLRVMDLPRWKDYHHYHNHKYGQVRFELGEIPQSPQQCCFPSRHSSVPHLNPDCEAVSVSP